jgi:pilus assembly protein CpaC
MFKHTLWRVLVPSAIICCIASFSMAQSTPLPPEPTAAAPAASAAPGAINFVVKSSNERMEMIVHSSRIITIGQKIPQAQVNNPDILDLTPLSPTQVQVSAKTAGVTQINLWGEDQKLFTIDVMVYGDAQELKMLLRSQFPNASLTVTPVSSAVLLSGYVDKPEHIDRIIRIAEEYYPKVINNMTVGGVQTVLLHVKVMEVSRSKLRRLGFDWAKINGMNTVFSGASGLLLTPTSPALHSGITNTSPAAATTPNNPVNGTFAVNVANGNSAFFGVLDALRQDNLMKIMAEPTLVAESGRAANFFSGGTFFIPVPQSLGTTTLQPYQYGTTIDFVPIVLGNGKIRLEVRPKVSELDYANSVTVAGSTVPGTKDRNADTAVELMAGQTLAIAGLVQSRIESENHGLPWISEVPYIGMAFRTVHEQVNEVELLILVTPELVDAMDANEVPQCGPGMMTTSPTDWELYMKGHLEVPNCCPNGNGTECSQNNGSPTPVPEDGMIGPEQIQTPSATDASKGASRSGGQNSPAQASHMNVARRPGGSSTSYNRNSSSKPNNPSSNSASATSNSPPGFIGPVGYDVVK